MNKIRVTGWILLPALAVVFARGDEPVPSGESPFSVEFSVGASEGVQLEEGGASASKMRTREYVLELEYERKLAGDRPRILTVGLEMTRGEFEFARAGLVLPEKLAGVGLEASLTTVHNARWLSFVSLTTGWRSVGSDRPQSDGFGVQGVVLGCYSVNERVQISMGAYGDSLAESGDRVVPILGVDWALSPRWRLSLGVPRTGVFCAVTDTLAIGLQAELTADTYAVADEYRRRYGLPEDVKVEYFDVRAGLNLLWRFTSQTSLTLSAGTIVARRLDFEADNYQRRVKADGIGGAYGTLEFSIRF